MGDEFDIQLAIEDLVIEDPPADEDIIIEDDPNYMSDNRKTVFSEMPPPILDVDVEFSDGFGSADPPPSEDNFYQDENEQKEFERINKHVAKQAHPGYSGYTASASITPDHISVDIGVPHHDHHDEPHDHYQEEEHHNPAPHHDDYSSHSSSHSSSSSGDFHCSKCGQEIGESQPYMEVSGRHIHKHCFTCHSCGRQLGSRYQQGDRDGFLCENCIQTRGRIGSGVNCNRCGGGITGGSILRAGGKQYHPDCFTCQTCGRNLNNSQFYSDGAAILCATCNENKRKNAKICQGCGKVIGAGQHYSEALGRQWHNGCFKCRKCGGSISGSYYNKNGQPFCSNCPPSK